MSDRIISLTFSICILGDRASFPLLKAFLKDHPLDWNDYGILHAYCAFGTVSELQEMFLLYPDTNLHVDDDLPFKLAVMCNSLEVVQYLVTKYSPFEVLDSWPDQNNEFGHSINALVCALKNGNLDLI